MRPNWKVSLKSCMVARPPESPHFLKLNLLLARGQALIQDIQIFLPNEGINTRHCNWRKSNYFSKQRQKYKTYEWHQNILIKSFSKTDRVLAVLNISKIQREKTKRPSVPTRETKSYLKTWHCYNTVQRFTEAVRSYSTTNFSFDHSMDIFSSLWDVLV